MMELFGALHLSEMMTESMLKNIMEKYHFQEMEQELRDAFCSVRAAIKDQERYEILLQESNMTADIGLTLGPLVDAYQKRLGDAGEMMKDLMAEQICWDVLAAGYIKVRDDLCEHYGLSMAQMHFWGGEEEYPLEGMKTVIGQFQHIKLQVTPTLSLLPSKSAVFHAKLEQVADMPKHSLQLCNTCNRRETCEYSHE